MHNIWIIFRTTNYILLWMMFQWFILRFGATHHIRLCVCMHFHWLFARAFFFVRMHQLMFNHMKFTVNTVCIRALQFQYLAHFGFLYRASYQSENHSIIFNFIFHIVLKQIATSSINSSFFLVYCQIDHFNQTIHKAFWNFSFKKLENEKKCHLMELF